MNMIIPTLCVLCREPHSEMWLDEPAWYCKRCGVIKNEAIGVLTEVQPGLYLGDAIAAETFTGKRLCVYCEPPHYAGDYQHIPILRIRPVSRYDRDAGRVSTGQMVMAVSYILKCVAAHTPLLVHCKGGVERSPLVIAYYLVQTQQYPTLPAAYAYLKRIRPVVSERLIWTV